jgi:hypothetical protein
LIHSLQRKLDFAGVEFQLIGSGNLAPPSSPFQQQGIDLSRSNARICFGAGRTGAFEQLTSGVGGVDATHFRDEAVQALAGGSGCLSCLSRYPFGDCLCAAVRGKGLREPTLGFGWAARRGLSFGVQVLGQ